MKDLSKAINSNSFLWGSDIIEVTANQSVHQIFQTQKLKEDLQLIIKIDEEITLILETT